MNGQEIRRQFDLVAREYDENRKKFIPLYDAFYQDSTACIAACITPPASILDLGAGTGLLTSFWYKHYPEASYHLVDIAPEMLSVARRRFGGLHNVSYAEHDYVKSLPAGNYDAIISALSIHHLEDDQKQCLFKELYKRLPEGGCLVNYDQFCCREKELDVKVNEYWERGILKAGLSGHDLDLLQERRRLDRECTVSDELQMMQVSGFRSVECIYRFSKFAVILAIK